MKFISTWDPKGESINFSTSDHIDHPIVEIVDGEIQVLDNLLNYGQAALDVLSTFLNHNIYIIGEILKGVGSEVCDFVRMTDGELISANEYDLIMKGKK